MASLEDIQYELPQKLIAVRPAGKRDESRLLKVGRKTGNLNEMPFREIVKFFGPGDVIVFNDTKVFKARLAGVTDFGKKTELLLVERISSRVWKVFIKNSKKFLPGTRLHFGNISAVIGEKEEDDRQKRDIAAHAPDCVPGDLLECPVRLGDGRDAALVSQAAMT